MNKKKVTRKEFLKRANEIHGNKYDYSLITEDWWKENYKNTKTKLPIICSKHGVFWQPIIRHIHQKSGCPKCRSNWRKNDFQSFINQLIKKKINKKFYFLFNKKWFDENFESKSKTYFPVKCKSCGKIYYKKGVDLYNGDGCKKCHIQKKRLTFSAFLKKYLQLNLNKLYYINFDEKWWKENYKNYLTPLKFKCKKCKKVITKNNSGLFIFNIFSCPYCSESSGERIVRLWLEKNKILYEKEFLIKFKDHILYGDFYLPDYKILIEYHGKQHYEEVKFFHRNYNSFEKRKKLDLLKQEYCFINNIKYIEISYQLNLNEIHEKLKKEILC